MTNNKTKAKILSLHLNEAIEEDDSILEDYLVLTDRQATKAAKDEILELLWAFNADFILAHSKVDMDAKYLTKIQGDLCESAQPLIRGMISNIKKFVEDAIAADGRGHFLARYDDKEHEIKYGNKYYYIYRIN